MLATTCMNTLIIVKYTVHPLHMQIELFKRGGAYGIIDDTLQNQSLSNELERGGKKYLQNDIRDIYRLRGTLFDEYGARSGSPQ